MPRNTDRFAGRSVALTVLLGTALGGCSDLYYDRRETVMLGSGDAVAANIAVQTVDPWPAAAASRSQTVNGERIQRAMERYRTNKTTPLNTTSTSSAQFNQAPGSGGGSGGGSSGGASGGASP